MRQFNVGIHTVRFPLMQGGMGVRVSGGSLAGHVAAAGGIGIVAAAGLTPDQLVAELERAYAIAPGGIIGVNLMVALAGFEALVAAAILGGAKLLVCGAGLPLTLPGLTSGAPDVALCPIVSSLRAAQTIAQKWQRSYGRLPDAVVVEDPDTAGGHLGEKLEVIGDGSYDQYGTIRAIKKCFAEQFRPVPVIAAGGIWGREDLDRALEQGADAVQMASRFVATLECDASDRFKAAYLNCRKEDIGLIMSPAGLPGRAIVTNAADVVEFDRAASTRCTAGCLKKCTYKERGERFCILQALQRAYAGEMDAGLVFCGTNAWKADRLCTVQEIFEELFGAEAAV